MATYKFHPSMAVELGFPIDPLKPFSDKSTNGYFGWRNFKSDIQSGAQSIEFKIEEAHSRKELYEKVTLDTTIEAKFGLTNATATLNWEREKTFEQNTLVYVAYGKKVFNRERFSGERVGSNAEFEFTEKGKRVWEACCRDGKISEFQRAAGTEYITEIKRASSISIIYTFTSTTSTLKEKIRAKLEAGWTSGSVNIDFKKELNSIDEGLIISKEAFQFGVNPSSQKKITDIINAEPGNMKEINEIVSAFLGSLTDEDRSSCPIAEFTTAPIFSLEDILLSPCSIQYNVLYELSDKINIECIKLHELLVDCFKKINSLEALLAKHNSTDFKPNSLELLKGKIQELKNFKDELFKAFIKCINAKSIQDCSFDLKPISSISYSDILNTPFLIPLPWQGGTVGTRTSDILGDFGTTFFPVVHIRYLDAISHVFLIKNSSKFRFINFEELVQINKDGGSFKSLEGLIRYDDKQVAITVWNPIIVESERKRFNQHYLDIESHNAYELEVVLVDGTFHRVALGNPKEQIPINLSFFPNLPQDGINFLVAKKEESRFRIIDDREKLPTT